MPVSARACIAAISISDRTYRNPDPSFRSRTRSSVAVHSAPEAVRVNAINCHTDPRRRLSGSMVDGSIVTSHVPCEACQRYGRTLREIGEIESRPAG